MVGAGMRSLWSLVGSRSDSPVRQRVTRNPALRTTTDQRRIASIVSPRGFQMPASRREFLYGFTALSTSTLFALERTEPDLILYNGNFWTVNPRQPRAQAVAISGGRFLAIGTNDEVLALAAGNAKKIDLGGKTVLPGFIDAHSHPAQAGLGHLRMVDCDLRSITDILKALRERAAKTPP